MDIGISVNSYIYIYSHVFMSLHQLLIFLLGMPCKPEHHSQYLPEGHHSWSISFADGILKAVPQQPHQHQLPCMEVDFVSCQIPISKKMGANYMHLSDDFEKIFCCKDIGLNQLGHL